MKTNNVDLDAARAARAETVKGSNPTVTFGGVKFDLPVELPFAFVGMVGELVAAQGDPQGFSTVNALSKLAQELFRDHYEEFMALGPSMADIQVLLEGVAPAYGMALGESPASES